MSEEVRTLEELAGEFVGPHESVTLQALRLLVIDFGSLVAKECWKMGYNEYTEHSQEIERRFGPFEDHS